MLYLKLIFTQDDVSWYEVEIKITTSTNELRDSEILRLAACGKPSTKLPRGGLLSRFILISNHHNGAYHKVLLLI